MDGTPISLSISAKAMFMHIGVAIRLANSNKKRVSRMNKAFIFIRVDPTATLKPISLRRVCILNQNVPTTARKIFMKRNEEIEKILLKLLSYLFHFIKSFLRSLIDVTDDKK